MVDRLITCPQCEKEVSLLSPFTGGGGGVCPECREPIALFRNPNGPPPFRPVPARSPEFRAELERKKGAWEYLKLSKENVRVRLSEPQALARYGPVIRLFDRSGPEPWIDIAPAMWMDRQVDGTLLLTERSLHFVVGSRPALQSFECEKILRMDWKPIQVGSDDAAVLHIGAMDFLTGRNGATELCGRVQMLRTWPKREASFQAVGRDVEISFQIAPAATKATCKVVRGEKAALEGLDDEFMDAYNALAAHVVLEPIDIAEAKTMLSGASHGLGSRKSWFRR